MVVISPYVLHRHRRLWRDPDLFDPGRFLGGDAGTGETVERFAYLPFGVGPRLCIGATFALQEATLVVAALMRHFVLEVASGESVWPVIDFTLRPRGGLRMTATRRRQSAVRQAADRIAAA